MLKPNPLNSAQPIFAPPLTMKLYDNRFAGMYKPVCGVSKIDLSRKLPWSADFEGGAQKFSSSCKKKAGGLIIGEGGKEKDKPQYCHQASSVMPASGKRGSRGSSRGSSRDSSRGSRKFTVGSQDKEDKEDAEFFRSSSVESAPVVSADTSSTASMDIGSHVPVSIVDKISEVVTQEDTGAGVFGALKHVDIGRSEAGSFNIVATGEMGGDEEDDEYGEEDLELGKSRLLASKERKSTSKKIQKIIAVKKSKFGYTFNAKGNKQLHGLSQSELEEEFDKECALEEDAPPAYMRGRTTLASELEDALETSPFETYTFYRGQGGGRRSVGVFKGLVRILSSRDEPPAFDLSALLKPKMYTVRLYVLRGLR